MNGIVALVLAFTTLGALAGLAGAVRALMAERERAAGLAAELAIARAQASEAAGGAQRVDEAVRAQASLTAATVAEQLVARAAETFKAQEEQAKLRLEAQLKPVSETLARFNEQVAAAEKARAEETGGL
jgi:DNA recombination protein RmuC